MKKSDRTVTKCDRAVETEAVAARTRDIRTESRRRQFRSGVDPRKEIRCARFLDRNVQPEDRRVRLPENSENITVRIDYRDCHPSIASDRLSDRSSNTIC